MLQLARRRAADRQPALRPAARAAWITGDMIALPFTAERFSVVTTGYGLRNVPDLRRRSAKSIACSRRAGGCCRSTSTARRNAAGARPSTSATSPSSGQRWAWLLHGDPDTYRYIPESIRNYPGAAGVARLLEAHGFARVRAMPVLFGLMAIHVAHKPE